MFSNKMLLITSGIGSFGNAFSIIFDYKYKLL